jgi:hypothetical protein
MRFDWTIGVSVLLVRAFGQAENVHAALHMYFCNYMRCTRKRRSFCTERACGWEIFQLLDSEQRFVASASEEKLHFSQKWES